MAKLSVIVPAYNAETTLRTAVESILSQQVPGLEIIIVNDGSTDATDKICHALASQNQCIHVITQKNAGICAARNRGLEAASGEFLTFCDDDDLLWQGALKLLLQTAEDTHADIVRGGYELLRQRPDGTMVQQPHPAGQACTIELGSGGYGSFLTNSGPQFVWNALYRRTALLGLRFNERCSFGLEDFVFNAAAYRRVGKAVYIPQVVYRHFEVRKAPPARTRRRHFWAASGRWSHGWRLNFTPPSAGAARRTAGRLEGSPRSGSHIFDAPAAGRPRPRRHSPPRLADTAAGAGPVSRRDG
ncbi:MAG: glycosyltransferase family 2 protein [Gemmiger sp.]